MLPKEQTPRASERVERAQSLLGCWFSCYHSTKSHGSTAACLAGWVGELSHQLEALSDFSAHFSTAGKWRAQPDPGAFPWGADNPCPVPVGDPEQQGRSHHRHPWAACLCLRWPDLVYCQQKKYLRGSLGHSKAVRSSPQGGRVKVSCNCEINPTCFTRYEKWIL